MNDHIVMNVDTRQYECQHCGATQSAPKMPVPIDSLLEHMDMFSAAHQNCKASTDEAPPPTEYEQGFEAGYSFVVAAIESQLDLPPYDEHTAILERLLDYLRH
jgi:hypothetical protein